LISHPKPRVTTDRVDKLLKFVDSNHNLDWKRLHNEWNREYDQWKYGSESSMQVVYYRAKSKVQKPKGGRK
jgi:hypothetical protein